MSYTRLSVIVESEQKKELPHETRGKFWKALFSNRNHIFITQLLSNLESLPRDFANATVEDLGKIMMEIQSFSFSLKLECYSHYVGQYKKGCLIGLRIFCDGGLAWINVSSDTQLAWIVRNFDGWTHHENDLDPFLVEMSNHTVEGLLNFDKDKNFYLTTLGLYYISQRIAFLCNEYVSMQTSLTNFLQFLDKFDSSYDNRLPPFVSKLTTFFQRYIFIQDPTLQFVEFIEKQF